MLVGYSRTLNVVRFIDKSTIAFSTNTNTNAVIPNNNAGDMLIAVIMHRDTLTPPSGWTLVDTASSVFTSGGGGSQKMSVYQRVSTGSGDTLGTSKTWIQATNQPIASQILSFRKTSGTPSIIDNDNTHADNDGTNPYPNAVSTATGGGQMGVVFSTCALATAAGAGTTMILSMTSGGTATQTTPFVVADNRMCGGYASLANGQTTAGSISSNSAAVGGSWASISLIIG